MSGLISQKRDKDVPAKVSVGLASTNENMHTETRYRRTIEGCHLRPGTASYAWKTSCIFARVITMMTAQLDFAFLYTAIIKVKKGLS
jgi:hypothetical protein